jgi:ketosteroid isomerase-like protein
VSSEAEENKALVRCFFEARVKTDLDALDKMLAPDFVSHTKLLPGLQPDREGYKRTIAEFSATFSNRRFIVEEQVAEGETVVTKYVERSIIRGEFAGLPRPRMEKSPRSLLSLGWRREVRGSCSHG